MVFYLFRHGETYFSKNGLPYGKQVESANILPESISQAKDIASKLDREGVRTIYSSPIKRCVQTVKIIKKEVPAIKCLFLQELEEEKISRGLENLTELIKRLQTALDKIKTTKTKRVGICTHGWPLAIMIALLQEKPIRQQDLLNHPKCGELIIVRARE